MTQPTGNFGGGTEWFSGQVRNLPPVIPKNSFESDVKSVTSINNSEKNGFLNFQKALYEDLDSTEEI